MTDEDFLKLRGRVVDRIGEDLPPSKRVKRNVHFFESPFRMGAATAAVMIAAAYLLGEGNPITMAGYLVLGLGTLFLGRLGLIFGFVGLPKYFWFSFWFALGAGFIFAPVWLVARYLEV